MGHSYTTFKDKAILCKDYKLEAWLFLVCREIETMEDKASWLKEAKDFWHEQAKISINGCIDPNLDEFLDDDQKVEQFIEIIENIYKKLEQFGENIPDTFLNELYEIDPNQENKYRGEFPVAPYLRYGQALLKLLTNQLGDQLEMA